MNTTALQMRQVSKRYRFFDLQDVSLQLELGQIMGFVGPNGAGKSTTLRILMGMVHPDAGDVRLLDYSMPQQQALAKRDVAFVSDDMRLFGHGTLAWHMGFVASMYPQWDSGYAEQLARRFNLHVEQRVRSLSSGEHIKAALLLALARHPKVLILDEPTSGLDPVARHEVMAEIMNVVGDDRRAVLFSSHNTVDVERISDRITFIDRGRIVDSSNKEEFLERWRRVQLQIAPEASLPHDPRIVDSAREGNFGTVTTDKYEPELMVRLQGAGATIIEVQRMTLEEIFVANVMRHRQELAR